MALAGHFAGKRFHVDALPIRVMAVSRCHRAELGCTKAERGIFRVSSFTKVEMFSVCAPNQSEDMLDEFRRIEIDLFNKLNLHFKVLDMPACELGAPAYRLVRRSGKCLSHFHGSQFFPQKIRHRSVDAE